MGNTKRDYKGQTWQKVGQGDLKNRSQVRKSSVMMEVTKFCPASIHVHAMNFSISKEKNY